MNMLYNSLDATEDNLKCNIDLDLGSFECRAELNHDFITPNNNARNKILSLLLLAAACFNCS